MVNPGAYTSEPSEAEKVMIWGTFETFYLTSSRAQFHLHDDCEYVSDDPADKDVAVYPVGWKPICSACLARWRVER